MTHAVFLRRLPVKLVVTTIDCHYSVFTTKNGISVLIAVLVNQQPEYS